MYHFIIFLRWALLIGDDWQKQINIPVMIDPQLVSSITNNASLEKYLAV